MTETRDDIVTIKEKTTYEKRPAGNIHAKTSVEIVDKPEKISEEMAEHLWDEHGVAAEDVHIEVAEDR